MHTKRRAQSARASEARNAAGEEQTCAEELQSSVLTRSLLSFAAALLRSTPALLCSALLAAACVLLCVFAVLQRRRSRTSTGASRPSHRAVRRQRSTAGSARTQIGTALRMLTRSPLCFLLLLFLSFSICSCDDRGGVLPRREFADRLHAGVQGASGARASSTTGADGGRAGRGGETGVNSSLTSRLSSPPLLSFPPRRSIPPIFLFPFSFVPSFYARVASCPPLPLLSSFPVVRPRPRRLLQMPRRSGGCIVREPNNKHLQNRTSKLEQWRTNLDARHDRLHGVRGSLAALLFEFRMPCIPSLLRLLCCVRSIRIWCVVRSGVDF